MLSFKDVSKAFDAGKIAFRKKDYKKVVEICTGIISAFPDYERARDLMKLAKQELLYQQDLADASERTSILALIGRYSLVFVFLGLLLGYVAWSMFFMNTLETGLYGAAPLEQMYEFTLNPASVSSALPPDMVSNFFSSIGRPYYPQVFPFYLQLVFPVSDTMLVQAFTVGDFVLYSFLLFGELLVLYGFFVLRGIWKKSRKAEFSMTSLVLAGVIMLLSLFALVHFGAGHVHEMIVRLFEVNVFLFPFLVLFHAINPSIRGSLVEERKVYFSRVFLKGMFVPFLFCSLLVLLLRSILPSPLGVIEGILFVLLFVFFYSSHGLFAAMQAHAHKKTSFVVLLQKRLRSRMLWFHIMIGVVAFVLLPLLLMVWIQLYFTQLTHFAFMGVVGGAMSVTLLCLFLLFSSVGFSMIGFLLAWMRYRGKRLRYVFFRLFVMAFVFLLGMEVITLWFTSTFYGFVPSWTLASFVQEAFLLG